MGPEVFNAVVQKQQEVNASSVCALVVSLSKMRLSIKPAQDVEAFSNWITEITRWIEGTGLAPHDLSELVVTAIFDSDILTFQLRASVLFHKVDDDPSSQMADQIVRTLRHKDRFLLSQ
jgi:hypothetical protein